MCNVMKDKDYIVLKTAAGLRDIMMMMMMMMIHCNTSSHTAAL